MDYPPEAIADIRARTAQAERDSILSEVNALPLLSESGEKILGQIQMRNRVLQLILMRSEIAKAMQEKVVPKDPTLFTKIIYKGSFAVNDSVLPHLDVKAGDKISFAPGTPSEAYAKQFPNCTCIGHEPRCQDCRIRLNGQWGV